MGRWIAWAVSMTLCALGAQAGVLDDIRTRGEVRMGYRADAAPLSYASADKTTALGFAPELCRAVLRDLEQRKLIAPNTPIKYVPLTNAERFKAITERAVDMECADTTNNRERREKLGVAFTIPHYFAGVRILVPRQANVTRLEDLKGKRVLVTKGTTSVKIVEERSASLQLGIRKIECPNPGDCFNALAGGQGDAYMMDDIQLFALRALAPQPADWEVVGKLLSIEPLAIMLPRDDPVWKQHFDNVLRQMIFDRSFHALYTRWFEKPIPPNQVNFSIPMNYLLRDSLRFPSDKVGD